VTRQNPPLTIHEPARPHGNSTARRLTTSPPHPLSIPSLHHLRSLSLVALLRPCRIFGVFIPSFLSLNHSFAMSSNFGQWYEDQQRAEDGGTESSSSWFSSSAESLPLFLSSENMPSFASMRQSMEAQMPKKIMGMGYQQRFKVFCALLFLSALFFALAFFVGMPMVRRKRSRARTHNHSKTSRAQMVEGAIFLY